MASNNHRASLAERRRVMGGGKGKGKGGKGKGRKQANNGRRQRNEGGKAGKGGRGREAEDRKRSLEEAGMGQGESSDEIDESAMQVELPDSSLAELVTTAEPAAKRAKVDGQAEEEEDDDDPGDGIKRKKVKVAVIFGYLGTKYQGLQLNPGAHTVELVLERAMVQARHSAQFAAAVWFSLPCTHRSALTRAPLRDLGRVHLAAQFGRWRRWPAAAPASWA